MQFAWNWTQCKCDHFVLPGLRRYFELNGHTDVPGRCRHYFTDIFGKI
jgi:hypothetical protein